MEKRNKIILGVIILAIILIIAVIVGSFIFGYYDVTFDSKGGTPVAVEKVQKGKLVKEPNTPLLQGYVFDGWYLDDNKYDFNTPITEAITLTAKWHSIVQKSE